MLVGHRVGLLLGNFEDEHEEENEDDIRLGGFRHFEDVRGE
jgi:hypothetical protein